MDPATNKPRDGVPPARTADQAALPAWVFVSLVAVLVLGVLSLVWTGPHNSVLEVLYHSTGLLTHDSGWAFDRNSGTSNELFRLLAVIGPVVTAVTVIYFLSNQIRRVSIRMATFIRVVALGGKCVALIGLSDYSFALAASLRTTRRPGGRALGDDLVVPLIFTDETSGPLVERCARHGIALYPRHARGLSTLFADRHSEDGPLHSRPLHRAVNRANDLISFLPTADAQVDFLVELAGWSPRDRANCRAWILLEDRGLTQRLESQYVRFARNSVTPRLLAISTLAARQLLLSQQFDTLADAFGQAQVHLAIYGMGDLGRAIVKEAAQLYVTRPALRGTKLRITFFDADADAAERALFAEDPGLRNVIVLHGYTMHIAAAGLLETQLDRLPADVTGHIVTFEDGEAAFSLAVSLRRWLLEPPQRFDDAWLHAHHAAPIFVRAPSWHGLGRLFYKPSGKPAPGSLAKPDRRHALSPLSPLPDGIIGFGAIEGLFGGPALGVQRHGCLLDTQSETGAKAVHNAYRRKRSDVAVSPAPYVPRTAETEWERLSPQLRESNFRAFDHIAIKARAVGHRMVAHRHGEPPTPSLEPAAIETLERLEHLRYCAERMADGWRYARHRLDAVCVHPDLVDWADLDTAEQRLDFAQVLALREIAAAAKQRFANALIIGVVGNRPNRLPQDTSPIRKTLRAQLVRLLAENSERAPLVLTALAPGADTLAAEVAMELDIPFLAPLPLPYELYAEDFTQLGELDDFHRLAAAAELHVELPLRFGRASHLTRSRQSAASGLPDPHAPDPHLPDLRACQYALAGAYIVERADVLIAVSDGKGSEGVGGTADVLAWWTGQVPAAYATPDHFFVRPPARGAPIVIDLVGGIV